MVPSPPTRHDAGLIHSKSLDRDEFVMLAEELGLGRRVGHVRKQDEREQDCSNAEEDEDGLE